MSDEYPHHDVSNWIDPTCPRCGSGDTTVQGGYDFNIKCESCGAEVWF